jgi:RimJ/RimL family protein N-acetyltransferase
VLLEPLRGGHADQLAALLDDDYVRGALGVGDVPGLRRRFAGWETRRSPDGAERWLNWIVRDRADSRALGWVQATVRDASASVAYALLPSARGAGMASDAVRALLVWLGEELRVADVTAAIAPSNIASARVARAAGLSPTEEGAAGEVVWRAQA